MDESWGNTFIIQAAVYIRINRLTSDFKIILCVTLGSSRYDFVSQPF